jgi:hypothetical protein
MGVVVLTSAPDAMTRRRCRRAVAEMQSRTEVAGQGHRRFGLRKGNDAVKRKQERWRPWRVQLRLRGDSSSRERLQLQEAATFNCTGQRRGPTWCRCTSSKGGDPRNGFHPLLPVSFSSLLLILLHFEVKVADLGERIPNGVVANREVGWGVAFYRVAP